MIAWAKPPVGVKLAPVTAPEKLADVPLSAPVNVAPESAAIPRVAGLYHCWKLPLYPPDLSSCGSAIRRSAVAALPPMLSPSAPPVSPEPAPLKLDAVTVPEKLADVPEIAPVNVAPERAAAPRFASAPAAVVAPVPPQGMPVGLPQEMGVRYLSYSLKMDHKFRSCSQSNNQTLLPHTRNLRLPPCLLMPCKYSPAIEQAALQLDKSSLLSNPCR